MLNAPKRLIIAITGASGAMYGVHLLQTLKRHPGVETHLVVSPSGWLTMSSETEFTKADVEALADVVHAPKSIGDSIASGSFKTVGMVVAPCSMHSLAAIANGLSDNLIARAADVTLKERRRLVLLTRETPLNLAHLRNMVSATEMGAVIMPPVPAFYNKPETMDDLFAESSRRVLDLFDLLETTEHTPRQEWQGLGNKA
jgi:polyprenyl P-hydroxybenzoate/phenylacrylic acid decarboxylase-like protein